MHTITSKFKGCGWMDFRMKTKLTYKVFKGINLAILKKTKHVEH
jgi:hypothetical protein